MGSYLWLVEGIIGISSHFSLLLVGVQGSEVQFVIELPSVDDSFRQIRVGDAILAETDKIAVSFPDGLESTLRVETIVSDDEPAEVGSEGLAHILDLVGRRDVVHSATVRVLVLRLSQLHKANASLAEFLQEIAIGLNGVLIEHILDAWSGRKLHSDLRWVKVFEGDVDNLQRESCSVFGAASILVSPSVGIRPEELIN